MIRRLLIAWIALITLVWLGQSRAQFNGCSAGFCGGIVVGGGGGCSQATNFIARTSGLDAAHQTAYTTLICGLVSDGTWTSLDAIYIFATSSSANALLSLVSATYNATLNGATFTVDAGFTGNGTTTNIDSNFPPSTATSPNYTQNSATIFAWSNTSSPNGNAIAGYASGVTFIYPDQGGTSFYGAQDNGGYTISAATANGIGFFSANRATSTTEAGYRNGTSVASGTVSSGALVGGTLKFLSGDGGGFSNAQIMAGGFGSSLDASHQASLCSRIDAYLETIAGISHTC